MALIDLDSHIPLDGPGIANLYPCVSCASKTQLLAVLAVSLYALNNRGSYDVNDMVEGAKCYKCLTDFQMLQALVNAAVALTIANGYFDDSDAVLRAAECLTCTDPKTIKAIITQASVINSNASWPEAT